MLGAVQVVTFILLFISQPLHMNKQDLKARNITLLTPQDMEFENSAQHILGEKSEGTPNLKAASVVLQNNSSKPIVGYALTWHFVNSDGTVTDRKVTFVQPASLLDGTKKRDFSHMPSDISMSPATERLVSIAGSIGTNTNLSYLRDLRTQQQVDRFGAMIAGSAEATVAIDGILFEDGEFVGPDRTHFYEDIVQTFDCIQQFNKDLIALSERGASDREITNWVSTQVRENSQPKNIWQSEVNAAADEFLHVSGQYGIQAALRMIKENTHSTRPRFTKKTQ